MSVFGTRWLFRGALFSAVCFLFVMLPGASTSAQDETQVATPNFIDQRQRTSRPNLGDRQRIRFLTTTDFPPFNFLDERGRLTGFNVDLVRAICEQLDVLSRCQIQALPFAELVPALQAGQGEAIVAGLALTPSNRSKLRFTESYFRYPARFVTLKDKPLTEPVADAIDGKRIAVTQGSAHAALLSAFFPSAEGVEFKTRQAALTALREGEVAGYFGDGVALSFWLESKAAAGCCVFSGGPFLSDRFLGEGLAIAVAPNDAALAGTIDYAIGELVENGRFSELLLRYFPVSAF